MVKNLPANARDTGELGLIPRSGRSPGGGSGNSLQYSCWKLPGTEEPGGRQCWCHKHDSMHLSRIVHRSSHYIFQSIAKLYFLKTELSDGSNPITGYCIR